LRAKRKTVHGNGATPNHSFSSRFGQRLASGSVSSNLLEQLDDAARFFVSL
jgi:hypothetical protein